MIANFEEGQHMRIKFEPEWISEAEHLSLRFKVNAQHKNKKRNIYNNFSYFRQIRKKTLFY